MSRSKKRELINLYDSGQVTSDECYLALDSFIEKVFSDNNVSWEALDSLQKKTGCNIIHLKYNEILTILEMYDASQYDLNLCLDDFIDTIELYSAASKDAKGK